MNLDKQLNVLAELAGINIKTEEREKLLHDIEGILGYVEQLQGMDFEAKPLDREVVEADDHREDVVKATPEDERMSIFENFPAKTDDDLLIAHGVLDHKL